MMENRSTGLLVFCLAILLCLSPLGCTRITGGGTAANEYSIPDVSADLQCNFNLAWKTFRDVLRENPVEIYTRDKRGRFVAFVDMGRALFSPRRLRLEVTLKPVSETVTRATIETVPEAYTVQLLTSPAWRPAAFGDNSLAAEILDSVEQRVADSE